MILPLLGTIAKGAIKGMVGRKRRKKGEGAQVSTSIVKIGKSKKDKSSLVKPVTPIFGGGKEISETSSSIQSSSIMESLDKIDESIANIKTIIVSESKFKSKINADNLEKENLLMKRKREKGFKFKKTSMSITGKAISKAGSFLSRFLPFIVATLLGGVVVALYKGLENIIKFFQGIFTALNGFFAALDPFIRPILDFFNLFRKQDAGKLDPKIGENEEGKVKELEKTISEVEKQSAEFVKQFNKQKAELSKETFLLGNRIESKVSELNKISLNAQENTPQNTGDISNIDSEEARFYDDEGNYMGDQMNDTTINTTITNTTTDTTAADISSDITAAAATPEETPVKEDIIPDKPLNRGSFRPTTPLVPKKEEDKSSGNNISADKFFVDGKPPTIAGLRELEKSDMNARSKNFKIRNYKMNLDLYNKKMYGSNTPITFNGKTYEPGDPNYELVLKMTQAHFRKDLNKRDKLRQMIIKLEDQAFYETTQPKTNVVFITKDSSPQIASSGKKGGILISKNSNPAIAIDNLTKTALYKG